MIGAGLAGSEAALQLAKRGWEVELYEMRPGKQTEAHSSGNCAEVVCSNSFKSKRLDTASGLLKAELEVLGCELLKIARSCEVPAGHALAVHRESFSSAVTKAILEHPKITLIHHEVFSVPFTPCIIASGPLTSEAMMESLRGLIGQEQLYFFDAIAPIVSANSLNFERIYKKDRYDKGEADYLNCPFTKDEYLAFVNALLAGEKHQAHEFEDKFFSGIKFSFYENCMPIEEIARRGIDTLRHGVMKPMGLEDPSTGKKPYAVLQLRTENRDYSAYNLVGCQTMLRYPEQRKIFRMIPGMENAEFLRFGSIHRNSYLDAPRVFNPRLALQKYPDVWVAGQLAGVEGYVESIALGLLVALIISEDLRSLPDSTILGSLWKRLTTTCEGRFQPVNANFGLLPELSDPPRDKKLKKEQFSRRSLEELKSLFGLV
ncbi:MAG: methylenetetrahydrofolate--tRNA-(uracil(54)-C(5))-methyltransferase (FADH(2)-oxidizing) TrmFO [Candidatus Cloacimonetes bacterium]|nr:methylenetetrahydrofolate--tRNA-(uracil(54)-C(5))-methyltransferase (FADH(2)-oxidizing) TrmFO [Candidatus Cloacimonadota bacterium]